jgi:hypothetical protein
MLFRLIIVALAGLLLLAGCAQTPPQSEYKVKFAVVAVTNDLSNRAEVEDKVSATLQEHDFDALASHTLVGGNFRLQDPSFRQQLLDQDVATVLALRPIEVGPDSSIKSIGDYVPDSTYMVVEDFVEGYRGDDFTTSGIVEIGGFTLTRTKTTKIWHGVVWLDGEVENREAGIAQMSELILTNIQKWRTQLRATVGLPPYE